MKDNKGLKKLLALAGLAALVALPFIVFSKKPKEDRQIGTVVADDDSNIFAAELEE